MSKKSLPGAAGAGDDAKDTAAALDGVLSAWLKPDKSTSLKTVLAGADLDKAADEARARITELSGRDAADLSDEDMLTLQHLRDVLVAAAEIRSAEQAKVKAAADRAAAVKEIADQVASLPQQAAVAVPEALPASDAKPAGDAKPAAVEGEAKPVEVDAQVGVQAAAAAKAATDPVPAADASAGKELVGAGVAAFRASNLPIPATAVTQPTGRLSNVFAVDGAGGTTANEFGSMAEVAEALVQQLGSYPRSGPGSGVYHPLARWRRNATEEFSVGMRQQDDDEVINRLVAAHQPKWDRAQGQFAAGWCAPSETLYELCPSLTSLDGLVDVPEVVATRGGVRTTSGPDFATLYADASVGQILTEAQVAAGTVKTCIEVDCPPFTETRLDVNPLCVTGNLLAQAGYPEYYERFIREVVAANTHKINGNVLTRMATASTAVTLPGTTGPVDTSSVSWFLDAASLYATWLRERYRTALDQVVEVVAPHWYYQQQVADLSRRNGVDILVAAQRLNEAYAERNIRVQWVYDWQGMPATPALTANRATTVQVLIYLPGTFVKLVAPVISLGTLHSAAQLATNQYTALFVEDGFNVLERCFQSLLLTIPTCPSGTTGAASGSCDSTA